MYPVPPTTVLSTYIQYIKQLRSGGSSASLMMRLIGRKGNNNQSSRWRGAASRVRKKTTVQNGRNRVVGTIFTVLYMVGIWSFSNQLPLTHPGSWFRSDFRHVQRRNVSTGTALPVCTIGILPRIPIDLCNNTVQARSLTKPLMYSLGSDLSLTLSSSS